MAFFLILCFTLTQSAITDIVDKFHVTSLDVVSRSGPDWLAGKHHTRLSTFSKTGHSQHVGSTTMRLQAFDQEIEINMHLNGHLIPGNFRAKKDGVVFQAGHENCFYQGHVGGQDSSSVSMNACGDHVKALVYLDSGTLVVEPASIHGLEDQGSHVVYRVQDMKHIPERSCDVEHGHEKAHIHGHESDDEQEHILSNLQTLVASGRKLEADINYVELKIISDVRETEILGASAATARLLEIMNNVQTLYDRLDGYTVIFSIMATDAWTVEPSGIATTTTGTDIGTYLGEFRAWAAGDGYEGQDNTHLMIGYDLSGGTAGVAYVNAMCGSYSVGVSEDSYTDGTNGGYMSSGYDVWTTETVTHEIGHNFGASHDSDNNGCTESGWIMAAVGSVTSSATVSNADWSSCSESYIGSLIQGLSGTSGDCMANVPDTTVGEPVCGDAIVDESEDCEPLLTPGICNSDCTWTIEGAECSSGTCCDTSTGLLKISGTPCRESIHQCDIVDRCDGVSNECGTDYVHQDGTACDEAGEGGFCVSGSCKGVDGQCAVDFALYSSYGSWLSFDCMNDPCGTLYCSTDSLQPSCYSLTTGSGGAEMVITVDEGTPCDDGDGDETTLATCVSGTCTAMSVVSECPNDCGGQGDCSNEGVCVCYSGYSGDSCLAFLTTCPHDCASLNRQGCVSDDLCGDCLSGYGTYEPSDYTSDCELVLHTPSEVFASSDVSDPNNVVDNDYFSHWIADFTTGEADITLSYDSDFSLHYYEVMSANTLPSEDPSHWFIEGSNDGSAWTLVDERSDVSFSDRHQIISFTTDNVASYSMYRMVVTDIRDAVATPSLQIAEIDFFEDPDGVASLGAASLALPSLSLFLFSFVLLFA